MDRMAAVKKEREERLKRLKNYKDEMESGISLIADFHSFLSILDMEKHGKKADVDLSNAISGIAGALTNLNKYYRENTN